MTNLRLLEYYDGPVTAVTKCINCNACHIIHIVCWSPSSSRFRIFGIASISSQDYAESLRVFDRTNEATCFEQDEYLRGLIVGKVAEWILAADAVQDVILGIVSCDRMAQVAFDIAENCISSEKLTEWCEVFDKQG